jgi:tripartite-type tricarboxylate transporter receptor subunit TctC
MTRFISLSLCWFMMLCGGARAQGFPDRAITLVVPFAASGPMDVLSRTMAVALGKYLKQPVIIENIAGAGGSVGAAHVARAAPDGYTMLVYHVGMATTPSLYRNLPYEPLRDYELVGEVADVPMTLVARSDFPAGNLKELLAHLKAHPGRVRYAHAGAGSGSHLCGLLLEGVAGVDVQKVVYKGTGLAMGDLLSGKVDLMCDLSTTATPQIQAGKIKSYGVTTPQRLPTLPLVPTLREGGLGVEVAMWHGLYLPRGTPKPVVDKMVEALHVALQDPGLKELLKELGTEPVPLARASPQSLRKHLESEMDRWSKLIKGAGEFASLDPAQ